MFEAMDLSSKFKNEIVHFINLEEKGLFVNDTLKQNDVIIPVQLTTVCDFHGIYGKIGNISNNI